MGQAAVEDNVGGIRRTQRPPKSCLSCAKVSRSIWADPHTAPHNRQQWLKPRVQQKRIRCSQGIPCQQCIEKNIGASCRRETVMVKGQILRGDAPETLRQINTVERLLKENNRLREENQQLRRWSRENSSALPILDEAARSYFTSEGTLPSLSSDLSLNELVYRLGFPDLNQDVGGDPFDVQPYHELLEDLNLHNIEEAPSSLAFYFIEHLQQLAPIVDSLIQLVFSQLSWLFAPVRYEHIALEHESLWEARHLQVSQLFSLLESKSSALGLYCSLLAVGLLYLKSEQLDHTMSSETKLKESRVWFDLALKLLEQTHFMSNGPDVTSMLTFCVLTCLFQTFGQAAYHDNLQAVMLRSALALRMHRLAQMPRVPSKWNPEDEDRRRIWAYLGCREGMFLAPGVRFGLQAFDTTDCPHLLNVSARDLCKNDRSGMPIEKPLSEPTEASFLIAQSRLAWLFNSYRGRLQHTTNRAEAYALTLDYDKRLQALHVDQPYFALPTSVAFLNGGGQSVPTWLATARHVFTLNILQKRLLLHRRFFALSFQDSTYITSRDISTDTALAIFTENRYFTFPFDEVLDTMHNTLTAVIVLIVDLLHPETCHPPRFLNIQQRLDEIDELLSTLKSYSNQSRQLNKAHGLLTNLLVRYRQSHQVLTVDAGFPLPWDHQEESPLSNNDKLLWSASPPVGAPDHATTQAMADDATINWLTNLQDWLQVSS